MRACFVAVLVVCACHHTPTPVEYNEPCPGPYTIRGGTCVHEAPTACQGLCGYILQTNGCAPVKNAIISPFVPDVAVPNATSDETGRFDLVGIAPGHYKLRVMARQDDASIELDVSGGSQPLATPLELTLAERGCGCGGDCPN
jgi:hypothetical protein